MARAGAAAGRTRPRSGGWGCVTARTWRPWNGSTNAWRPWGRVQRTLDHLSYVRVRYCSWPTRTIFVSQSFNASLHEPAAPFANRVLVNAQAFGDFLALQPFCTKQDHPASIRE